MRSNGATMTSTASHSTAVVAGSACSSPARAIAANRNTIPAVSRSHSRRARTADCSSLPNAGSSTTSRAAAPRRRRAGAPPGGPLTRSACSVVSAPVGAFSTFEPTGAVPFCMCPDREVLMPGGGGILRSATCRIFFFLAILQITLKRGC